jgi:hypothetical protein
MRLPWRSKRRQLSMAKKLFDGQADISCDLAQEQRRNIPARMIGDSRAAPILTTILHVRAALPNEDEAKRLKNAADFPRFENGRLGHESYAAVTVML